MDYDEEKLDEVVLALLYLTLFTEHGVTRAWKGHDWDVLNRLCEKGPDQRSEEQEQICGVERRGCQRISKAILEIFRQATLRSHPVVGLRVAVGPLLPSHCSEFCSSR